jgi:CubicO group peptidase (beta-lactamase class C family)
VSPGFEPVRDAFAENFTRRHELGGAHRGEKVVDLWGGVRNKATGDPWEEDTMVIIWSATKGLAAMTLAVAHSRGWLDYEERVSTYWPEFARNGKETITVRQLLAHQAGLFAFDEPVDRSVVADLDRLAAVLARQKPAWPPGRRQAYHALTLGFYEGELMRRIDPRHRSLGRFFQDEIATPLGLDLYIRLPESIPNSRLATLASPSPFAMLLDFPIRLTLASFNRRSNIYRALMANPGTSICLDKERIYARDLEVPSGGGVGTARAIARAYSAFATGGGELGLGQKTLLALSAPAIPAAHGFFDECLKGEVRFSLGFMKPSPEWSFGSGHRGQTDRRRLRRSNGAFVAGVGGRFALSSSSRRIFTSRRVLPTRRRDGSCANPLSFHVSVASSNGTGLALRQPPSVARRCMHSLLAHRHGLLGLVLLTACSTPTGPVPAGIFVLTSIGGLALPQPEHGTLGGRVVVGDSAYFGPGDKPNHVTLYRSIRYDTGERVQDHYGFIYDPSAAEPLTLLIAPCPPEANCVYFGIDHAMPTGATLTVTFGQIEWLAWTYTRVAE